jgi:hypothetical protein
MSESVPPLREGGLNRGGKNRDPMRPRPAGSPPATGVPGLSRPAQPQYPGPHSPARPSHPEGVKVLTEQSPIEAGTFNKGGINWQPMTPRPDFVPALIGPREAKTPTP